MLPQAQRTREAGDWLGVSDSRCKCVVYYSDNRSSTPVPLTSEKFYLPDAVRILDALVETLTF